MTQIQVDIDISKWFFLQISSCIVHVMTILRTTVMKRIKFLTMTQITIIIKISYNEIVNNP